MDVVEGGWEEVMVRGQEGEATTRLRPLGTNESSSLSETTAPLLLVWSRVGYECSEGRWWRRLWYPHLAGRSVPFSRSAELHFANGSKADECAFQVYIGFWHKGESRRPKRLNYSVAAMTGGGQ